MSEADTLLKALGGAMTLIQHVTKQRDDLRARLDAMKSANAK